MKRVVAGVAVLYMLCGISEKVFADDPLSVVLDRAIQQQMARYDIPGLVIAVMEEGRIVWKKAYGYADLKAKKRMTTDTLCRVESISKPVTAWGVMKLVDTGRVDLDAPVQRYFSRWHLPDTPWNESAVTVRRLLSHNAGMPLGTIGVRYDPDDAIPSLRDHLSHDARLVSEPGTGFSYSNAGYNVLELLIEEVTGDDFGEYMKHEVLRPLGMMRANFNWHDDFSSKVPHGYDLQGKAIPPYVYPDRASGGLFADINAVAAFLAAGMGSGSLLSEETLREMYTPQVDLSGYYKVVFDSYGLGYFIEELPGGVKVVSHGGQGSGWMTHFAAFPGKGDAIILLSNSQRSWPAFSYILKEWARWKGFSPLGMSVIASAVPVMWVIVLLISLAAVGLFWRPGSLLISGSGILSLSLRKGMWPFISLGFGIVLGGTVAAVFMMDYFFLFSVFPVAAYWMLYTLAVLSMALMLKSLAAEE